ncbi:NUDIX hydrolase [Dyadobacter diqingensis]|uniref:NUDIX hydrolase n=1 Tax=Dyadobacter diqingensis TaxID=2938121 RepID=UPI0020C2D60E|nr:NUDIX domain-containing protein [Dyadobacter diqingensis]
MNISYPLSEQGYIQQLSIDCVIFGYQDQKLKVLVPKLNFKGSFFALPSGFVYQDEDIDAAARRILRERTGIKDVYLEQFYVTGKASRNSKAFLDQLIELNVELIGSKSEDLTDERSGANDYVWFTRRFVSIGYYALVDISKVVAQKTDLDESIEWYEVGHLPQMIMDHNEIIGKALETFRLTLDQKGNAFNLLTETFTMKDAQQLYETIYEKQYARNNFQKKILDLDVLERLEKKFTGAANKAPYLYRLLRKG